MRQDNSHSHSITPTLPTFSKSFAKTPLGTNVLDQISVDSNDSTNTSSEWNPPTPCMPAFSKSFAKTPMGMAMSGLKNSNLNDISDISAVTPMTPEDSNGCSSNLFGTPSHLFLGSGVRGSNSSVESESPFAARHDFLEFEDIPQDKENQCDNVKSILRKKRASIGTPLSMSVANKRQRRASLSLDLESELLFNQLADNDLPVPDFSLDLFPKMFQHGEGAAQVTSVYSAFDENKAYSISQMKAILPKFGADRLELMLDMLVSKGLVRPFSIDTELMWRLP